MPGRSLPNKPVSEELKESSYMVVSQDENVDGEVKQALRKIPISVLSKYIGVDELKKVVGKIPFVNDIPIGYIPTNKIYNTAIDRDGNLIENENIDCWHYTNIASFYKESFYVSGVCRIPDIPLYVFKDMDGIVIDMGHGSGEQELNTIEDHPVIIPKGATDLYINQPQSGFDDLPLRQYSRKVEVGEENLSKEVLNYINPLYGKKVGFFGDSICYGNGYVGGYAKIIGDRNNMVVQNLGVGSSYFTTEVASSTIVTSVDGVRTIWTTLTNGVFDPAKVDFSLTDDFGTIRYATRIWNGAHHQYDYTEISESTWDGLTEIFIYRPSIPDRVNFFDDDCDYIIGEGGINDAIGGLWIGEHTDGYDSEIDPHSVIGGAELLCRNMLKRFPGKKLGFVLVHKVLDYPFTSPPNADGTQEYYFDELKRVFAKYSIPVLDLYNESGLNTGMSEFLKYTHNNDGVHPNEEGYRLFYVDAIESWMRNL